MKVFSVIRSRNLDMYVYALLIFFYGLGWDYVLDKRIEPWSAVGVISYTAFVLTIFARNQLSKGVLLEPGQPEIQKDSIGKVVVGVILFVLLLYRFLS